MKVACLHFVCVKSFCKKRSEIIPNDLIYITTSTLHNLSQNPSNDSYTKDSVRTSGNNMDLDIEGPIHFRINNPFNAIVGYLDINSLRNMIHDFGEVFKKVQIDILCIDRTELDKSYPDSQFEINRYQFPFLRRDRDHRGGEKLFL